MWRLGRVCVEAREGVCVEAREGVCGSYGGCVWRLRRVCGG